jgi:hypothetical protein
MRLLVVLAQLHYSKHRVQPESPTRSGTRVLKFPRQTGARAFVCSTAVGFDRNVVGNSGQVLFKLIQQHLESLLAAWSPIPPKPEDYERRSP